MSSPNRRILFTADAKLSIARAADPADGKIATLAGYALTWNTLSTDDRGYRVRLAPGSASFATPTLALWNHDASMILGNTANKTLRLSPDATGVRVEIDLPDTTAGRDAEELVEKGYVAGMSFAMVEAPWSIRRSADGKPTNITLKPKAATKTIEAGETVLTALAYVIDEITLTAVPAFPGTSVGIAEDDEPEEPARLAAAAERTAQSLTLARMKLSQIRW